MTARAQLGALVLAALLAIGHTWPLARDLAGQSRLDNADTALNTWIVSWVAHQLPRNPAQVFDAPIFHPERRTLAYSEHLLAQGAMAVPLAAAGLSPTAIYNLLVLAGLTLGAWAMWRLVAQWTGDVAAGAVAGAAFAFNAHLLTRFGQLQALHPEFVPIVLLALDRLVTGRRWRDALLLALGIALVGLTSIYLFVFVLGAIAAGALARAGEWRRHALATLGRAAVAVVVAGLLLAPVLLPYWHVNRELGLERSIEETARYGATWRDYLATGGTLHYALWSHRFFAGRDALFPGLTVLALAAAAFFGGSDRRQAGRRRMLVAIAATGVVLSVGPAMPLYEWLYDTVPLLRATRVASRWGVLWLFGLAGLAGLGTAAIRARLSPARARAAGLAFAALVTVEAARTPMSFTPTPAVPDIYRRIAALPRAVLLEFPLFPATHFNLNAPYLLAQTVHFHPIVAGYSGFAPPGFTARVTTLGGFPNDEARALIRTLGITHVVLHVAPLAEQFGQAAVDAIDAVPWLRREFADDEARVYLVLDVAP
jgi:hypothetical protein